MTPAALPLLLLAAAALPVHHSLAEVITGSAEFDLSACAITFFGEKYTAMAVSFANSSVRFCSVGENPDCLVLMDPQADRLTVDVVAEPTDNTSRVHESLPNIRSTSPCRIEAALEDANNTHMFVTIYSFGRQSALEVNVTTFFPQENIEIQFILPGTPMDLLTIPKQNLVSPLILDMSACRHSDQLLLPGKSAEDDPTSCVNVTCSAEAELLTPDKCLPTEFCRQDAGCVPRPDVCSVTGSTVVDFNGLVHSAPDRCVYTLVRPRGNGSFHIQAGFRERRRRDVTLLDFLDLSVEGGDAHIFLGPGGKVTMDGEELHLNETVQEFHGVELSRDQSGVTAQFSNITVYFDGTSAHIAGALADVEGVCGDPSDPASNTTWSDAKSPSSESGCDAEFVSHVNETIDCNSTTELCEEMLRAPFSACRPHADPDAYVSACTEMLCDYPAVDGLRCEFLKAFSKTCTLRTGKAIDWAAAGDCTSDVAVSCLDRRCSSHEFCGEENGEARCLCRADFAYKHKSGNTLGDPAVCTRNSASLSLAICLLEERGVDHSFLHLLDRSCRGHVNEQTRMVTFDFALNKTCGTKISTDGNHVIYTNTIMTRDRSLSVVYRNNEAAINFSCSFQKPPSRTLAFKVKESSVVERVVSGIWNYTLSMNAYVDASHTKLVDPDTAVDLNQRIWMELKTDGLDGESVAMVIDSCWATSRPEPNDTVRYDLIINGCPNPADGTVKIYSNGAGTSNYFSFNMFEFSADNHEIHEVYLHCKLEMCLKQAGSCVKNCRHSRRRRSARQRFARMNPTFISMNWTKK